MTDLEMLHEMLKMQHALNQDIIKKKKLGRIKTDNLFFALFDELGELTHELKADWCWWKIHVSKDNTKVLEEFVDCVHFALTYEIDYIYHRYEYFDKCCPALKLEAKNRLVNEKLELYLDNTLGNSINTDTGELDTLLGDIQAIIDNAVHEHSCVLWEVLGLGLDLGFTMEDIYNEYLKKNKVNFERLANGY